MTIQVNPVTTVAIVKALGASGSFDFEAAMTAIHTNDVQGILLALEQGLDIAAIFLPQAAVAEKILVLLGLLIEAYQKGYIQSAQVGSPAMDRAAGPDFDPTWNDGTSKP